MSYNSKVKKIFACMAPIILKKLFAMLIQDQMNIKIELEKIGMC